MVKMDKASISAKSYEQQQKEDKAGKSRNFVTAGFSWLKTQFSSGSHHNVEEVKPVEPVILMRPVSEKPIEKRADKQVEKTIEKSKKYEGEHKHRHKSISKGTSKKGLKNHDEQSEPKLNTVLEVPRLRKKNHKSGSHVSFSLEATEACSALSGSEDHDLMPPVKNNVLVDVKPLEPLSEDSVQTAKNIESKIELPELISDLSLVSESQEMPVPVMFEAVSKLKEVEHQEQLQTLLESAPQAASVEEVNQPEQEEPGEDFSRAIRHRAFEKHKRNSQRLSGQFPRYDEAAFIEGGSDVDFIRIQNGKGSYWADSRRPGQVAGQINHDQMDSITYQRLGYLASLGDSEAHEKIEAAKNRNGTVRK